MQQQTMYAEKWAEDVIKSIKNPPKISQDCLEASINNTSQAIDSLDNQESTFLFILLALGLGHAVRGEKIALLCLGVATIATLVEIYIIKLQIEQLQNTSKEN